MSANNELIPFRIIGRSFGYVWAERSEFIKMASLPIIVLSILSAVLWLVYPPEPLPAPQGELSAEEATALILSQAFGGGRLWEMLADALLYVMFAVAWHRFFLVEDEETTVARALSWDANKTYFLFSLIGVFLAAAIAGVPIVLGFQLVLGGMAAPGSSGAGFLFGTLMAVMFYTMGRLSLVFPAAAVGLRIGLRGAWNLSKGSGWRMAMILMLPYIPTFVAILIMATVLHGVLDAVGMADAATGKLIMALGTQAVAYFGLAVGVSALSMAYRELTSGSPV